MLKYRRQIGVIKKNIGMDWKRNIYMFAMIILFIACSENPNKAKILGDWQVIDWTITATGDAVDQRMLFTFKDNDRYLVDYGSEKEEGYFRVNDEWLFTKEDERAEKSVRIVNFSQDTLILEMNRAGRLESLILERQ